MKNFYGVKAGKKKGIYKTWDECKSQVNGFKGAEYKSFSTYEDAKDFVYGDIWGIRKNELKNSKDIANIYIDGSFDDKIKKCSYGMVILHNNKELINSKVIDHPALAEYRNVTGEIAGACNAMNYCIESKIPNLNLYYDYEGIKKWCTGEWDTKCQLSKSYNNFYKKASKEIQINFKKVKSHSGNKYNELADKAAREVLLTDK
jgi:ribonuclease HI